LLIVVYLLLVGDLAGSISQQDTPLLIISHTPEIIIARVRLGAYESVHSGFTLTMTELDFRKIPVPG